MVSRSQKRLESRYTLYGQVNAVDMGTAGYETYSLVGGSDDLKSYNTNKKSIVTTYVQGNSVTAVRVSPNGDFLAYATGYDWAKGIY